MIVKNGKSKTVVEIEKKSSRVAEERDKKNTVSYELNEEEEEKEGKGGLPLNRPCGSISCRGTSSNKDQSTGLIMVQGMEMTFNVCCHQ